MGGAQWVKLAQLSGWWSSESGKGQLDTLVTITQCTHPHSAFQVEKAEQASHQ